MKKNTTTLIIYLLFFILAALAILAFSKIVEIQEAENNYLEILSKTSDPQKMITDFDDITIPLEFIYEVAVARFENEVFLLNYATYHGDFGVADMYHIDLSDTSVNRLDSTIITGREDGGIYEGVKRYNVDFDEKIWDERQEYVAREEEVEAIAEKLGVQNSDLTIKLTGDKPNFLIPVATEYNSRTKELKEIPTVLQSYPTSLPEIFTPLTLQAGSTLLSDEEFGIMFEYNEEKKELTLSTELQEDRMDITLFFQDKEIARVSDCSATYSFTRNISKTKSVADASLKILFEEELAQYGKYESVKITDEVAEIMLESDKRPKVFVAYDRPLGSMASCESAHLFSVVRDTLTQYSSISDVKFFSPAGEIIFQ